MIKLILDKFFWYLFWGKLLQREASSANSAKHFSLFYLGWGSGNTTHITSSYFPTTSVFRVGSLQLYLHDVAWITFILDLDVKRKHFEPGIAMLVISVARQFGHACGDWPQVKITLKTRWVVTKIQSRILCIMSKVPWQIWLTVWLPGYIRSGCVLFWGLAA